MIVSEVAARACRFVKNVPIGSYLIASGLHYLLAIMVTMVLDHTMIGDHG